MKTTQVSRLRENWIVCFQPIKFEKIMDQPIKAKQVSASAPSRCGVRFQKMPKFSQKLPNISRNFRDTNQNNQSIRFPVLQEEVIKRKSTH